MSDRSRAATRSVVALTIHRALTFIPIGRGRGRPTREFSTTASCDPMGKPWPPPEARLVERVEAKLARERHARFQARFSAQGPTWAVSGASRFMDGTRSIHSGVH